MSNNENLLKMFRVLYLAAFFICVSADSLREVQVMTANCGDCGMTSLGTLSVKVLQYFASAIMQYKCRADHTLGCFMIFSFPKVTAFLTSSWE